ncbi:MAG: VPLPA-CTERM sorting domain-containing protein [Gammaproteobacteria bacterium]|nr:VPLPA-CTERM sorting domain-containing protein [Gammaproteobacteria bacterium]
MRILKILSTVVALFISTSTSAITYNFYQGGYTEGAFVSGTFELEDYNQDGQLSSFAGELIDFSMTFSGNSLVNAFSISHIETNYNEVVYNLYDLGNFLGDDTNTGYSSYEQISAATGTGLLYGAGAALGELCVSGFDCGVVNNSGAGDYTYEMVVVSSVPVPAAVWLFGSGLLGLIGVARRKNHSCINND